MRLVMWCGQSEPERHFQRTKRPARQLSAGSLSTHCVHSCAEYGVVLSATRQFVDARQFVVARLSGRVCARGVKVEATPSGELARRSERKKYAKSAAFLPCRRNARPPIILRGGELRVRAGGAHAHRSPNPKHLRLGAQNARAMAHTQHGWQRRGGNARLV